MFDSLRRKLFIKKANSALLKDRVKLASNHKCPLDILRLLMDDESPTVRAEVAKKSYLTERDIFYLAQDKDSLVRISTMENPNATERLFKFLLNDQMFSVRSAVLQSNKTPFSIIKELYVNDYVDNKNILFAKENIPNDFKEYVIKHNFKDVAYLMNEELSDDLIYSILYTCIINNHVLNLNINNDGNAKFIELLCEYNQIDNYSVSVSYSSTLTVFSNYYNPIISHNKLSTKTLINLLDYPDDGVKNLARQKLKERSVNVFSKDSSTS